MKFRLLTDAGATAWGPLSQPIHEDVPEGASPWRDNAYLCFWDPDSEVFGALHVSTSPHGGGGRSRLSLHCGAELFEIIEPLESGTFSTPSVRFELNDRFTIASSRLKGELQWEPRFQMADYTGENAPVAYGGDGKRPLEHFQRGARVRGHIEVDGRSIAFDGYGMRDRTWGYRDESSGIDELIGYMWMFPSYAVTSIRLRVTDGTDVTVGFRLDDRRATAVKRFSVIRDAAGLFVGSTVEFDGGDQLIARAERRGGHWCPLGAERCGPTHSAFDEFSVLRNDDGEIGFGMTTQGFVRRLY